MRSRARASKRAAGAALAAVLTLAGCADADADRRRDTTRPTYDRTTGRLKELTFDRNGNGTIDTWTDMDGARPIRSRMDTDEDGRPDRWEYYGPAAELVKVGFSRKGADRPDAWAFQGPDGAVERIEMSSTADEGRIDRREFHSGGALARAEEDTTGDGRVDKWEEYDGGVLLRAAFDENGDGAADRRLTYGNGRLVLIETEPDAAGRYTKQVTVR